LLLKGREKTKNGCVFDYLSKNINALSKEFRPYFTISSFCVPRIQIINGKKGRNAIFVFQRQTWINYWSKHEHQLFDRSKLQSKNN